MTNGYVYPLTAQL